MKKLLLIACAFHLQAATTVLLDGYHNNETKDPVGVPHELVTIPGGKHGNFTADERTRIYVPIHSFLAAHGLGAN
jgi:hypothetical protein